MRLWQRTFPLAQEALHPSTWPRNNKVSVSGFSGAASFALFSSKRRTRYGSEGENRRTTKLLSFVKQKQQAQLQKLKQALVHEKLACMSTDGVSASNGVALSQEKDDDLAEEQDAAVVTIINTTNHSKQNKRMWRLKEEKRERVKHLPLFRPDSPLERQFGPKTLWNYEHLPVTAFNGEIAVIHSPDEEATFASYLLAQKVVGVDTESKPDFLANSKKPSNPVCLIQIATLDRAFIYRLQRNQPLPPVLQQLFADPEVLKVGHSLHDDFRLLKASQLVLAINSTVDTLPIAHKLGCLRPGLKTLCQMFLGESISKEMQVSNWEAPQLSHAQIQYAATDAWAPLRVLLMMIQLEDTRVHLRTKSYNSAARTVVDDDHDKVLARLHSFALHSL